MLYDRQNRNYRPRVPFSEWFTKLKTMEVGKPFHTIRFIDKFDYYEQLRMDGTIVDIYMTQEQQVIARCRITDIQVITVYDMTEELVKADTYEHWTLQKLWALLQKFYQGKPEWKGRNTRFILIYLEPLEIVKEFNWQPVFKHG